MSGTPQEPTFDWLGPDPMDPLWMRDDDTDRAKGAAKPAKDKPAQTPKGGGK